jgi:hypothetical protein
MAESSSEKRAPKATRVRKTPSPASVIRTRRLMTLGCLPVTLVLAGVLLVLVNLMVVVQTPTWVPSPTIYRAGTQLLVSVGALAGMQFVGTWLLGIVAAATGARAARQPGSWLDKRLRILEGRLRIGAWAIFVLRTACVFVVLAGLIWVLSEPIQTALNWNVTNRDLVRTIFWISPLWIIFVSAIAVFQWLAGPFLRLRYSMALGMLATTWSGSRQSRVWLALGARFGAGLAGLLTLMWGGTIVYLIAATLFDPYAYASDSGIPILFYGSDSSIDRLFASTVVAAPILVAIIAGQILLPILFMDIARRRLAAQGRQ